MVKRVKSIDGFVVRPRPVSQPTKKPVSKASTTGVTPPRRVPNRRPVMTPEDKLLSDIEDSLSQIGDLDLADEVPAHPTRRRQRQMPDQPKLKPKRHLSKGKIIKRIVIIIIVVLLGIAGYLGVKALLASGKIFKGNPLAIFTNKARLAEDKNGRTNILIFGTSGYSMSENAWDGAMLTDSIMLVSIDQDKNNAYMISLPRDLYVKYKCPALGRTSGKLNEVFYCAYTKNKDEKAGAQALMSKVGEILGLNVHYYMHADWTALVQSVNAVGGVDVKIESTDRRGIYDSGTKLRFANGEIAHLDGEKALALARARNHNPGDYGLAGSNYDREKNQQKILAALQQKALAVGTILNPTSVNGLINSMGDNLISSFDTSHVQTLIGVASKLKLAEIKQLPFVGRQDGGEDLIQSYSSGGAYVGEVPVAGVFDYSVIQAYIAKNLSKNPVVREGAVIDVLNGSGQEGLAAGKAAGLKTDGYTVGVISNAPTLATPAVTIYQLNSAMTKTAEALKHKYNVEPVQGGLAGYHTKSDFVIVYGAGSATTDSR